MTRPDPERISVTAKLAAHYRAFSDVPFASDVARFIRSAETVDALVGEHGIDASKLNEYAPMFEARYKSIAALLVKLRATQVLELASGFSLRGLAIARDHDVRYVESDLHSVNAEKRKLLTSLSVATRGAHSVVTANVLEGAQLRAAVASFDRKCELFVVCEGLMQYLSVEERETLATNIRALMNGFSAGTWITPDFSFRMDSASISDERKRMITAVAGLTERALNECAFESESELDAFFCRHQWRAEKVDQVTEAGELVSVNRMSLNPQTVERLRGRLGLWVMRAI
ncbi:class I SAM-dependent methyltransferase [Burkholderia pyrrocinia]|uniref:class I SAM-dependent methyltransferase n=1 Tax=Burkholderia pyrrocinia TaxID=60550 RepID=UPI00158ED62C|nr:class I SAM-dependent methyltransferase [Burkholderia pyrrocinia]